MTGRIPAPRKLLGLLAAALLAWTAVVAATFGMALLEEVLFATTRGEAPAPRAMLNLSLLRAYALVGLPVAVVVTFAVGLPLWYLAEALGWRSRGAAIRLGAAAGLLIAGVPFILNVIQGWRISEDENFSFNTYRWGFATTLDGWPTTLGWVLGLGDLVQMAALGAAAGFAARWVAMRPATSPSPP